MEKLTQNEFFLRVRAMGISVPLYSPEEFMQKKLEALRNSGTKYGGMHCQVCNDTGFEHFIAEGEIRSRRCGCMDMRMTLLRMEQSGLRDALKRYSFENYQAKEPWQKHCKEKAMAYAADPKGWFFVGGQSGSGKTHLCTAIAGALMLGGHSLVYMPWREDAAKLKTLDRDSRERLELLEKLQNAPYLLIDDFLKAAPDLDGRPRPTPGDINLAFDLISYRYLKELPTIISSELYPWEIANLDQATAGRIAERAGEFSLRIQRDPRRNRRMAQQGK